MENVMSKIKDLNEEILSQEELDKLESMENDYLESTPNINVSKKLDNEDMYNAHKEYNLYLNELEDNAELFSQEDFEKLKSEEGFQEYLKLTPEQKNELFPLSNIEEFELDLNDDLNNMLIEEEFETRILD